MWKKHKVQSIEELLELKARLDNQLSSIDNIDEQIEVLCKKVKAVIKYHGGNYCTWYCAKKKS